MYEELKHPSSATDLQAQLRDIEPHLIQVPVNQDRLPSFFATAMSYPRLKP